MLGSLQALRAMAAILVMLFHGTVMFEKSWDLRFANDFFRSGGAGVDMFFVISGFIIYFSSEKLEPGWKSVILFAKRRIIRIYPVYWLITIPFIFYYLITPSPRFETTPELIIGSLILAPQKEYILEVAWTLRFEILFYFIFGSTFFFSRKFFFGALFLWISIGLIFGSILNYQSTSFYSYWISGIVAEFGYGVLIAYLFRHGITHYALPMLIGGFLMLVEVFLQESWLEPILPYRELCFGIPSAFIVYGAINSIKSVPSLLMLIGDASYSLYLLHATLISQFIKLNSRIQITSFVPEQLAAVMIMIFVIIISVYFYRYIEKPILNYLNRTLLAKKS